MKERINYRFWYILAFFIASFLMLMYKYPEALDIVRTFERAESDAIAYSSLFTYIKDVSQSRIDFIYYGFLFVCVKLGVPLGLATACVLFAYLILLVKISTMLNNGRVNKLIILSALIAVPTVTVISVSRNTFADVFFLLGLFYYCNKERRLASIFFIIAVFSHFSVLIYIALLFVAVFMTKFKFVYKYRVIILFAIIAIGFAIPTFLNEQLFYFTNSYMEGTHYATYESFNDTAVLKATQLSNGDKLYFIYTFVMLVFLAIKDVNRNVMYWFMFLLCFLYAFYFNSSVQMSLRLSILTPVVIGFSLNSLYKNKIVSKHTLQYISYGIIIVTIIYYYSVRSVFINI